MNQWRLITSFHACTHYVKMNRIKYAILWQLAEPEYKAKRISDWRFPDHIHNLMSNLQLFMKKFANFVK